MLMGENFLPLFEPGDIFNYLASFAYEDNDWIIKVLLHSYCTTSGDNLGDLDLTFWFYPKTVGDLNGLILGYDLILITSICFISLESTDLTISICFMDYLGVD
jgi:hypothetical protein